MMKHDDILPHEKAVMSALRRERFYRDLALDRAEEAAREAYQRELERW